jgi:hypothetical protein
MDLMSGLALGGFAIQLGYMVYNFGKQSERQVDLKNNIEKIDKYIHNGFTCKHHADMTEKVGKLQGQMEGKDD